MFTKCHSNNYTVSVNKVIRTVFSNILYMLTSLFCKKYTTLSQSWQADKIYKKLQKAFQQRDPQFLIG